jgi:hypothetical protein
MYSEFTGGNEKYTHVYEKFLLNVFQVDKQAPVYRDMLGLACL